MANINWTVESVDQAAATMVVKYNNGSSDVRLNIPMPITDADVNAHIASYAPVHQWKAAAAGVAPVSVGHAGVITEAAVAENETPQVNGSWNEEYIRALIYQVMEEINEAKV